MPSGEDGTQNTSEPPYLNLAEGPRNEGRTYQRVRFWGRFAGEDIEIREAIGSGEFVDFES